jgi:hypothetical protein
MAMMALLFSSNCTFIPPSFQAWTYAVTVHGLCCVVGAVPLAILLYSVTSPNLRKPLSVFIGIATAALVPLGQSYIESYSPDESITWIGPFLACTFGFSTFFKSINAGFGQFPEGADADLKTWLMWFVILPEPEFTKGKLRKASTNDILNNVKSFLYKIMALFVLLSILLHSPQYNLQFSRAPEWLSTYINGFLHIWLIYLWASFCLDFSTVANLATTGGIRSEPGFLNPLLESRSLKEAWGYRWDLPVQVLLKRTVYIPARKQGFGRSTSAIFTFFASGLLHEYNFSIHNRLAYEPGRATVFFVLMGLLMLGESMVWNQLPRQLQQAINKLPSVAISFLVTFLVAGTFERFFFQSWVDSGFVAAAAAMLPHMNCR